MATDWNLFVKHPFIKIIGIAILVIIAAIVGAGLFTDKHIKIWEIEFNGKNSKSELVQTDSSKNIQTPIKKSTLNTNLPLEKSVYKLYSKYHSYKPFKSIITHKPDTFKKNNPITIQGKNIVYGNISGGNVQVGDINNGSKPREVTDAVVQYISMMIPNKSSKITFQLSYRDKEAASYVEKLAQVLLKMGYTSLNRDAEDVIRMGINNFDAITINKDKDHENSYFLYVYPISNVQ